MKWAYCHHCSHNGGTEDEAKERGWTQKEITFTLEEGELTELVWDCNFNCCYWPYDSLEDALRSKDEK